MRYDKANDYRETILFYEPLLSSPDRHGQASEVDPPRLIVKAAAKIVRRDATEQSSRPADQVIAGEFLEVRTEAAIGGSRAKWRGKWYRVVNAQLLGPLRQRVDLVLA